MSPGLTFLTLCVPSLFSIVDPVAAIPIYLALAGSESPAEQRRTAVRAAMTVTIVLTTFAATGTLIFRFFGITVPAFKIAGGALLFSTALEMMRAEHRRSRATPEETSEAQGKSDVGIIPIGIPLLSGPGAIATAVMWSSRARGVAEHAALFGSIALVAASALLSLLFGSRLVRLLGQTGINIATRIMGLILAATAAQFLLDGWREAMR